MEAHGKKNYFHAAHATRQMKFKAQNDISRRFMIHIGYNLTIWGGLPGKT